MPRSLSRHAVVIGASMAGLATARVLADIRVGHRVDRDRCRGHRPRKGVPQGRQAHGLLTGGARASPSCSPESWRSWSPTGRTHRVQRRILVPGRRVPGRVPDRPPGFSASGRPSARRPAPGRDAAHVSLRTGAGSTLLPRGRPGDGVKVSTPTSTRSRRRPRGRRGGRASRPTVDGGPRVRGAGTVEMRRDVGYASVILPRARRPRGSRSPSSSARLRPPSGPPSCRPPEGGRWIVAITAGDGRGPNRRCRLPGRRPQPALARDAPQLEGLDALGPVVTHRLLSNKRRREERLPDAPAGFLALGDAICSFNPIYGQGMTTAALQADALGQCLAGGARRPGLVRASYRRPAKVMQPVADRPGADFALPRPPAPSRPAPIWSTGT